MLDVQPKYSDADLQQRGEELFTSSIEELVAGHDPDHFLAIDVDTGDFEVDEDLLGAAKRLRERRPGAQIWLRRVGARSAMRIGGGRTT